MNSRMSPESSEGKPEVGLRAPSYEYPVRGEQQRFGPTGDAQWMSFHRQPLGGGTLFCDNLKKEEPKPIFLSLAVCLLKMFIPLLTPASCNKANQEF